MKNKKVKTLLIILLLGLGIVYIAYLYIISEIEQSMQSLFKIRDIEILDSHSLSKTNNLFIYMNSQILGSEDTNTKFLTLAEDPSCGLREKPTLVQGYDLKGFAMQRKDSVFIISGDKFDNIRVSDSLIVCSIQMSRDSIEIIRPFSKKKSYIVRCN